MADNLLFHKDNCSCSDCEDVRRETHELILAINDFDRSDWADKMKEWAEVTNAGLRYARVEGAFYEMMGY